MRKKDELAMTGSCWNKAHNGERVFVLLARDAAAPIAIRAWAAERIRSGKNKPDDAQIINALDCASLMEHERANGDFYR